MKFLEHATCIVEYQNIFDANKFIDLLEQEFQVYIVTDACSSRTERNRDAAFDRLAGMGAELVTTEMVLFEWLRSAESDAFREIQALIK